MIRITMPYLVLMKHEQAFSQILSSLSSAASSCCSSASPSFCSSFPHVCGEHDPSKGKDSRSHQTMRTNHLHLQLALKKKTKTARAFIQSSTIHLHDWLLWNCVKWDRKWSPSYPWFCRSPAAADTSVPGCTSARGWRAAGYTAAAETTPLIPRLQNAGRCWPLVKVYISVK